MTQTTVLYDLIMEHPYQFWSISILGGIIVVLMLYLFYRYFNFVGGSTL